MPDETKNSVDESSRKIRYSSSGVDFTTTAEEDLAWYDLRRIARSLQNMFTAHAADPTEEDLAKIKDKLKQP